MRSFLLALYSLYAAFWFVLIFLLLFPFFWLFLQREAWKPRAHYLNRLWGKLFFPMIGMPIEVHYEVEPDPKRAYVFCANHFSYLDIAAMGLILENYYAFVGKSALKKAPLFGYMFAKLHIQVDRADSASRAKSLQRSIKALQSGRSIVIFPEGGIKSQCPPQLHRPFKDGAFRMAIGQQVPVVPISLLNNHKRLPDKKKMRLHPGRIRAIVHAPIETTGMTLADVDALREQTFAVIDHALHAYASQPVPQPTAEPFRRVTPI
jgi:1-acyl-sn-glycerol-3-phosphate acyltransferase